MAKGYGEIQRRRPRRSGGTDAEKVMILIEAAKDIFLAKGFHSATMDDVAQAAGMSKKTVYQLVNSKAELFIALLEDCHTQLVFPTPKPDWSDHRILFEHMLAMAKFLLSGEQLAIIRLIMAEYTHSPDLSRVFHHKRFRKAKTKLESCLMEIATRQNAQFTDISEISAMLFGMTIGELHLGVLVGFRPQPSKAALERRISQAVSIFLAGSHCVLEPAPVTS